MLLEVSPYIEELPQPQRKKNYAYIREKVSMCSSPAFGTFLVNRMEQRQMSIKDLKQPGLHYSVIRGLLLGEERYNNQKTPGQLALLAASLDLDPHEVEKRYYEEKTRPFVPSGREPLPAGRTLSAELEKVRALGLRFSILVIETIESRADLRLSTLAHTLGIAPNTLYAMLEHRDRAIPIEETIRRIRGIADYIGKPADLLLSMYLFNEEGDKLATILSVIYQMISLEEDDWHILYAMLNLLSIRRQQQHRQEDSEEET